MSKHGYKTGDRVRIINRNSCAFGKEGTVALDRWGQQNVMVDGDERWGYLYYGLSEIEPLDVKGPW